LIVRMER